MRRTVISLIVVCWAIPSGYADTYSQDVSDQIRAVEISLAPVYVVENEPHLAWRLDERMAHYKTPGVSVAVMVDGDLVWAKGYGLLDAEGTASVNTDTVFQAASISKPISAVAALRLVEQGKLLLDKPVNGQLVSWQIPDNEFTGLMPVTLRHLLSHGGGLTVHGFPGYVEGAPRPTAVEILQGAAPTNSPPVVVDKVPGESWRYSGGGYTVLQVLMEDVTGRPFGEIMADLVLRPAGMSYSRFEQPLAEERRANAARGHAGPSSVPVPGHSHGYPELAAAGLWTTPEDLVMAALALVGDINGSHKTFLDKGLASDMVTPQIGNWGLGPTLTKAEDGAVFSHGGANEGFRAEWFAYKDGRGGAAIMTNADNGAELIIEIQAALAAVYGWSYGASKPRETITLSPEQSRALAGAYEAQVPDFGTAMVTVTNESDGLWIEIPPFVERTRVYAASPNALFMTQGTDIEVETDNAGRAIGLGFGNGLTAARTNTEGER